VSSFEAASERPTFSAVVASLNAERTIVQCLRALQVELSAAGVSFEIVVADSSIDRSAELAATECPKARIIRLPSTHLIPELWSRAIDVARGSIIGVTTAHCVPARGWASAMLAANASGFPGVGGAIECAPNASSVDRAIYFTRYSAYMLPFAAREVEDIPGDNSCYDSAVLRHFPSYIEGPFWESFLHRDMRREGIKLKMDPAPIVVYVHSFGTLEFVRQRFIHGWHFGATRSLTQSNLQRWFRALSFPLTLAVVVSRAARRVWRHSEQRGNLVKALPLMTIFFGSYVAGECAASVFGARRSETERKSGKESHPTASD
jgi:glycosyltransferase involved in cell wall biosynthesis